MQRTQKERFEGITNSRYTNIRERSRKMNKDKTIACTRIRDFREQNISGMEVELDCRAL